MSNQSNSIRIGSHFFAELDRSSKFYQERIALINWLNGPRQHILIVHCNSARLVQDLKSYVIGKPYEKLSNNERLKEVVEEKGNIAYFTTSNVEKFCRTENLDINLFTRNIKNAEGNYYQVLILMSKEKWSEISRN